jgi:hypothetical protein
MVFSVIVREKCKDNGARNAARLVGVAMLGLLLLFSYRMTTTVESLQNQLTARKAHEALANQISVVAAEKDYSIASKRGTKISITKLGGGQFGPVSLVSGCEERDESTDSITIDSVRGFNAAVCPTNGHLRRLPSATSGRTY